MASSRPEPDFPPPPPPCPSCGGFGFLEAPGSGALVPCACRAAVAGVSRLSAARIPERYRGCSLANYNVLPGNQSQDRAKAIARRFVQEWPGVQAGLLFVGPVGVGKTHLAVALLAEVVDQKGARGLFCDFTDLLDRIQATFGRGGDESADDVISPYREAEVLVLDELGARRPTDFVRDVLYGLLNTRYNRRRVTIVTTNYTDGGARPGDETLESRVGVPVRSRLAEMCQLVPLAGDDFRQSVRRGRAFA